jgi:anti-sigma regulatory factor (Ser/Thr protein kinase)
VDPAHGVLQRTTSADDSQGITEARHRLVDWAGTVGLSPEVIEDVALAGYEALTNAAEHAYPTGVGDVDLFAGFLAGGIVLVTVRDHGRWLPPADAGFRGRGLVMMKGLTDRAGFEIGEWGTVVHLGWNATPKVG